MKIENSMEEEKSLTGDPLKDGRVNSMRIGVRTKKADTNVMKCTTVTHSKETFEPQIRVRKKRVKSTHAPGGIRGSQRV